MMELNPEQTRAVETTHPRVVVIAGAGAGKTRVLAARWASLLKSGVPASRLLAITFTRAAAEEMRERIEVLVGGLDLPEVRTFHSWGAQLLRRHAHAIHRTKHFQIYDPVDEHHIAQLAAEQCGMPTQKRTREILAHQSTRVAFRNRLREGDALTFDDIERLTLWLLTHHEPATAEWRAQYAHVAVDEYQDTNLAQVAIMAQIEPPNLFVVGDARQCQPAGTMVLTSGGYRRIEELRDGDTVAHWERRGSFVNRTGSRIKVARRPYTGTLITVVAGGRETTTTAEHRWLVRWHDNARDLYCVYLMRRGDKSGEKWRIGWCKVLDESNGFKAHHYKQRARLEKADALYILMVTKDKSRASTAMFEATKQAVLYPQHRLDEMFAAVPGANWVCALLHKCGRDPAFPIWERATSKRGRQTLSEVRACNLLDGMAVPVWDGARTYRWEPVDLRSRLVVDEPVYSLDVAKHHAYVADGICTLNSIYKFRGADPSSITDAAASRDYDVIELATNYRSVPAIVAAANAVSAVGWLPMVAARPPSETAAVYHQADVTDEAERMVGFSRFAARRGVAWSDQAVLARTWRELEAIRDEMEAGGIPTLYYGGTSDPWATPEGRAVARLALLSESPGDDNLAELLARWTDTQELGLPLRRLRVTARRERRTVLAQLALTSPWSEILDLWAVEDAALFTKVRLAVAELGIPATEHMVACMYALDGIEDFGQWWARRGLRDRDDRLMAGEGVHLLTLHAAKGLEWRSVAMAGCHASGFRANNEEDRRLFYVGVTRARDLLYLTSPKKYRTGSGRWVETQPSIYFQAVARPAFPDDSEQPRTK